MLFRSVCVLRGRGGQRDEKERERRREKRERKSERWIQSKEESELE